MFFFVLFYFIVCVCVCVCVCMRVHVHMHTCVGVCVWCIWGGANVQVSFFQLRVMGPPAHNR